MIYLKNKNLDLILKLIPHGLPVNTYCGNETLLQKEESAIRQHISYEHQIKLEYEKLLEKLEVMDLENKLLQYQIVSKIILLHIFIYRKKIKRNMMKN